MSKSLTLQRILGSDINVFCSAFVTEQKTNQKLLPLIWWKRYKDLHLLLCDCFAPVHVTGTVLLALSWSS